MPRSSVLAFVFLLVAVAGCAASRDEVLSRALAGVEAADKSFVGYDKAHQGGIVDSATSREQGERSLAEYRGQRDKVTAAFVAAYGAIAVASVDANDAAIKSTIDTMATLVTALRELGVIPGGK